MTKETLQILKKWIKDKIGLGFTCSICCPSLALNELAYPLSSNILDNAFID